MTNTFLTHVDLFSGIGGFALAARWAGFQTVAFVEIDDYARAILKKNFMADGENVRLQRVGAGRVEITRTYEQSELSLRSSPRLYTDIRDFDGAAYRGATLLTGGFPCQPFSQAGKRAGTADDRHLWPEMHRVIGECHPAWVVAENVAGIVTMELDNVLSDLEGEGYAVCPFIIPACAVDARHRRDRVWIVGHANGAGLSERWRAEPVRAPQSAAQCGSEDVADAAPRGIRCGEAQRSAGQFA